MLLFLTILMMLIVAYAHFREGIFTAATTLVNVLLAGLVAFHFWEPLAGMMEKIMPAWNDLNRPPPLLWGYEDFLCLVLLFCVTLAVLRVAVNNLAPSQLQYAATLQQFGAGGVGLVTGYLASGFLLCAMQTLPVSVDFMGFEPRMANETPLRRYVPADRVWLTLMRHAGAVPFARAAEQDQGETLYDRCLTFDPDGAFELRFLRYRRFTEQRPPMPYLGEMNRELRRR